jgi:Ca-activated chloride channel family protein
MVNYFSYRGRCRVAQGALQAHRGASDSPVAAKLVHIGIRVMKCRGSSSHSNLVLLLDVSSSMSSPDRLPLAIQSMELLLDSLKPTDTVAMLYTPWAGLVTPTEVSKNRLS